MFPNPGCDMIQPSKFILVLFLLATGAATAGAASLLAHYPLQSDDLDATGLNDPMTLINAPFQDGGVYCNGIYPGGDPDASVIQTPGIAGFDPEWCAVSIEFKMSEYPSSSRPALMCGMSWRWMGVDVRDDGTIGFRRAGVTTWTTRQVSLDEWHEVMVAYDGTLDRGTLYVDGDWACDVDYEANHGDDTNVCTHDGGSGRQFLGLVRNLKVYDEPTEPMAASSSTWGEVKATFR